MKKILAICDEDKLYLARLQEYLERKMPWEFQILSFASLEQAIEYSRKQTFEIFLTNEKLSPEQDENLQTNSLFYLSHQRSSSENTIYKYQSVEAIYKYILNTYMEKIDTFRIEEEQVQAKFYSFFSPTGSKKLTMSAMSMGQILAKQGKKVLYLNLNPFNEFVEPGEKSQDLLDLMCFGLKHQEKLKIKIDCMKKRIGNLDYLPSVKNYDDLLILSKSKWREFLELMERKSGYEMIILDFSGMSMGMLETLAMSHKIFMEEPIASYEKTAFQLFEEMIKKKDCHFLLQMLTRLQLQDTLFAEQIFYEHLDQGQLAVYLEKFA